MISTKTRKTPTGKTNRGRTNGGKTSTVKTFALGAVAGAAAMYISDPEGGRRRRHQVRNQVGSKARSFSSEVEGTAHEVRNRAKGAAAEATRPLRDRGPDNDQTLADRVRSEVLADPRFKSLNVDVADGAVTVRGVIEQAEARSDLVAAIQKVPGVDGVVDLTHLPGTPAPNL